MTWLKEELSFKHTNLVLSLILLHLIIINECQ